MKNMKARAALIIFPLLLVSFLLAASAGAETGPFLKLAEKNYQSPPRRAGETVTHDFIFTNTGSAPLKVAKVSAGCRCTVVSYDRVVPPGGSGKVTLSFHLDPAWAGRRVSQSAVMLTNAPAAKRTRLTLAVDVLQGP